ncbi:hypothetical protein [Halobacillus naozhouensis]|uniref:glycosyltransferase n=1 Tax=Halobacillus naozhouensis TaxID=554880 RepID=UPI0031FDC2C2
MKILMVNFPAEGHVNPTLGMVKGFTDRGDDVHYITTEQFKERLEGLDATVHLHTNWLRFYAPNTHTVDGLNDFLKIHKVLTTTGTEPSNNFLFSVAQQKTFM